MLNIIKTPTLNIFNPVRGDSETQKDFKERRLKAKIAVQSMTLTGKHSASGGINQRQQLRDNMRKSGSMSNRKRFYTVLMNTWASRRRNSESFGKAMQDFYARNGWPF